MPRHRIYVEPYCGGASIFLRKPRSYASVLNDLYGDITNLFAVLRDHPDELIRAVILTPFARSEFNAAFEPSDDPVERARRLLVRSHMGHGSGAATASRIAETGFRPNSSRAYSIPAHDWAKLHITLIEAAEALRGVVIESCPAIECMQRHDTPETLHYCDPPYVRSTRSRGEQRTTYRHEMTDGEHAELSDAVKALQGMVMVSGYRCDLYDELYRDWYRIDFEALGDGAVARSESIWLSPTITDKGSQ